MLSKLFNVEKLLGLDTVQSAPGLYTYAALRALGDLRIVEVSNAHAHLLQLEDDDRKSTTSENISKWHWSVLHDGKPGILSSL